jgi:hypothetical protein
MRHWLRKLLARLRRTGFDEMYDEQRKNEQWQKADPPPFGGYGP